MSVGRLFIIKQKVHCLLTHIMYTVYMYVYIDSNIQWRSYMESHGNVECAFATAETLFTS